MDRDEEEFVMTNEEHMDVRMSNNLDLNVEHECRSPRSSNFNEHSSIKEPLKLVIEFDSDDHAYDFYNKYAELAGFSIRKDWVNRSKVHGRVMSRKFTCFRQGHRKKDKRDVNVKKHRKETRTGCLAHMVITRQPNGMYHITQFEREHNHDDVDLSKAQALLESLSSEKEAESTEVSETESIQPKLSLQLLGVRFCPPEKFYDIQVSDDIFLNSKRTRDMKEGDAARLLYYFQRQHFENPSFFYSVQLDIDDKISNIFWADDNMIVEYGHFADVVCLDTTSTREADSRPLVQFMGLNHHRQVIIFGAALLYNDNVNSYKWLFQTFVEAMSGKKPKFILSDQDVTIVQALHAVLPETKHSICSWQMYLIALKHLHHVVNGNVSFEIDLRSCIFLHEQEEDFIQAWDLMLEKHGLHNNGWLRWMFREKEKWAIAYGRNTFFVERNGAHLCEQMADKLRSYLSADEDVLQFFKHFESLVNEQRYGELESNFEMGRHAPVLMANAILLKDPSLIYTHKAYEIFQREYEKSLNVVIDKCGERESRFDYKAITYGKTKEYLVIYDSCGTVSCNCMKFEHVGFLCSHALKVLDHQNIKVVPSFYILRRWTRDARISPSEENNHHQEEDSKMIIATRYKDLCHSIIKISARAAESDPAFEFAMRQLNEVMQGVERILSLKSDEEHNPADVNIVRNEYEVQDDILKDTDENENILPDKNQLNHCDEHIPSAPTTYISSHGPILTMSPLTQGLYTVEANHLVHNMYQPSNITINPQPDMYVQHNFYSSQHHTPSHSQFVQDPLIRHQFQDSMSNGTQLKQGMNEGEHQQASSFVQYNHRYRTAGV